METKLFSKNDEGFVCANCGKTVLPLGSSSRNHCPFCLCSLHVDIRPGDRANPCGGLMKPIKTVIDAKKDMVIIHRCTVCGETRRNRAARDSAIQPDNADLLIALSAAEEIDPRRSPDKDKKVYKKRRSK